FDSATAEATLIKRNASLSDLSAVASSFGISTSGWTNRVSDGGSLTTTYGLDMLGRMTRQTTPGGVSTYTIRELKVNSELRHVPFFAEVSLPHHLADGTFDGPAEVQWMSASDRLLRVSQFALDGTAAYDPPDLKYTLKIVSSNLVEFSRSTSEYHTSG